MTKEVQKERRKSISKKTKGSVLSAGALLASILVLSIAIFPSAMQGQMVLAASHDDNNHDDNNHHDGVDRRIQHASDTDPLPQPNDEERVLIAEGSNALFEPAAGLSNVFGPEGLFPMTDTFDCANALTCGVSAGEDSEFVGVFDEGNENELTGYTATYTSPVTYGPQQIEGHEYKIELTDLLWNSSDAVEPTRQAEFTAMVNNVGFDQIQHGASHIDRSDVPQVYDLAFLYGHARVTDMTENEVVAEDVFTHVMVAHVMDEFDAYRSLRDTPLSPNMVFLFAINIPPGTDLPGDVGELSPQQAQSFTPLPSDPSLDNPPPVDYPVEIPPPREGE
ncbi:MAG: hypothetical protein M3115_02370, partial [Thermoproteota archaeon]|nr:hypothetical protein [Thermoproteota archaeon]